MFVLLSTRSRATLRTTVKSATLIALTAIAALSWKSAERRDSGITVSTRWFTAIGVTSPSSPPASPISATIQRSRRQPCRPILSSSIPLTARGGSGR